MPPCSFAVACPLNVTFEFSILSVVIGPNDDADDNSSNLGFGAASRNQKFFFCLQKPKSPEEEPSLKRKDSKQSKFAEQMRLALRDVPTPEPIEEIDIYKSPTPTPPPSPPPDESSPVKTPSPKPKKDVKPLRPIEKLVSRPKIPTPPP